MMAMPREEAMVQFFELLSDIAAPAISMKPQVNACNVRVEIYYPWLATLI